MDNILRHYFYRNEPKDNENMRQLEELTAKIAAQSTPPEYPIMQVLIELSEHGVLGLNKEGVVVFHNLAATTLLKNKDVKGKSVFDILGSDNVNVLKKFISEIPDHKITKVDIDSSKDGQVFDILAYRVKNGDICFILFLINCLEDTLFKKTNCPMRENCPFNYKCNIQKEGTKP